jgi:hypothetical protein
MQFNLPNEKGRGKGNRTLLHGRGHLEEGNEINY